MQSSVAKSIIKYKKLLFKMVKHGAAWAQPHWLVFALAVALIVIGGGTQMALRQSADEQLRQSANQTPALKTYAGLPQPGQVQPSVDANTNSQPDPSVAQTKPASPSTAAKSTVKPAASLVLSKSSFKIQTGLSDSFAVSLSNGEKLNMPLLSGYSPYVTLNSAAGSAKSSWTVNAVVSSNAAAGTYALTITAQDTAKKSYQAVITVTVIPRPTFSASMATHGYAPDSGIFFLVNVTPKNGFNSPVSAITFRTSEPAGIDCEADPDDFDSYADIWVLCDSTNGVSAATVYGTVRAGDQSVPISAYYNR